MQLLRAQSSAWIGLRWTWKALVVVGERGKDGGSGVDNGEAILQEACVRSLFAYCFELILDTVLRVVRVYGYDIETTPDSQIDTQIL